MIARSSPEAVFDLSYCFTESIEWKFVVVRNVIKYQYIYHLAHVKEDLYCRVFDEIDNNLKIKGKGIFKSLHFSRSAYGHSTIG